MFKKSLLAASAVALMAVAGTASAAAPTFVLDAETPVDNFNSAFNPKPAGKVTYTDTFANLGYLDLGTDKLYKVTYTFLGKEAGYKNTLTMNFGGGTLTNYDTVGQSFTAYSQQGVIDFSFTDQRGFSTFNGDTFDSLRTTWGLLASATSTVNGGGFDYIIGLNDSAGGMTRDYDDMVVGITISAVPEPESLALMLAGLGCVAVVGRRRKQA